MTDEEFLALPYAYAMQHILRQKADAEIVRLRNLWDGTHHSTEQEPTVTGTPSLDDANESLIERAWKIVGFLNILGALLIAVVIMMDNKLMGIAVLVCAPFVSLVPFSVAAMMGRARRIEDHLALLASSSPRDSG